MNKSQLIAVIISVAVALLGALKLEFIKQIVSKIAVMKKDSTLWSVLLLFIVCFSIAAIGFAFPESSEQKDDDKEPQIVETKNKSREEVISDGIKDAVVLSKEIADEAIKNQQAKKQAYESSKPERWVYQLGEWTNKNNDASLLEIYHQIKDMPNVRLFKDGRKLTFFIKEEHTKADLEAGANALKTQMPNISIAVIDLMSLCDYRNPTIQSQGYWKLKRKNDTAEIEYFVAAH